MMRIGDHDYLLNVRTKDEAIYFKRAIGPCATEPQERVVFKVEIKDLGFTHDR